MTKSLSFLTLLSLIFIGAQAVASDNEYQNGFSAGLAKGKKSCGVVTECTIVAADHGDSEIFYEVWDDRSNLLDSTTISKHKDSQTALEYIKKSGELHNCTKYKFEPSVQGY